MLNKYNSILIVIFLGLVEVALPFFSSAYGHISSASAYGIGIWSINISILQGRNFISLWEGPPQSWEENGSNLKRNLVSEGFCWYLKHFFYPLGPPIDLEKLHL